MSESITFDLWIFFPFVFPSFSLSFPPLIFSPSKVKAMTLLFDERLRALEQLMVPQEQEHGGGSKGAAKTSASGNKRKR